jgi:cytochrome c-type biogenesis protein CcmH
LSARRKLLPWLALAVLAAGALVWATRSGAESASDRAHRIASELRCVECQGLSVADSEAPTARAERSDIRQRIRSGQRDAEIRQAYVDRYGEFVLLKPEGRGIGLLVWALPVIALVLGAGGIALALRRWRREPRLKATAADEELVARVRGGR